MLTRSKIKMQQSIRHTQQQLPYFNNEEQHGTYISKTKNQNSKVSNNYTEHSHFHDYQFQSKKNNAISRNQIMKQLKQEYQILKHLSIQDNLQIYPKKYQQQNARLSQSSSLSSSLQSKKANRLKEITVESPKFNSKEFQNVHLEKKQLEIVIANSMRKIEQLLNNQILLKKSIHELKNQIQGKGGVHQEYEKTIKTLQRTEEQLQGQLNKSYHQNEKSIQKIKELNEKIRFLQAEISNKDRELKQAFDQQRRIHQLLRIEKDRYLNIEIQCKTFKMEFDLLQKEKNNQMNRLIRQFQSKQGGNQKEMAYIIKKLQEEIKQKDKKIHQLLIQRQHLKKEKDASQRPVQKKNQKNYLQELMYKSRQMNDNSNKALAESVNLIYQKMAQLEKRNDQVLKREIQALKKKPQETKRTVNQYEYTAKIAQLQRSIQKETLEKNRLAQNIRNAEEQQYQLKNKYRDLQRKWKELQQNEQELKQEVKYLQDQLNQIKTHYTNSYEKQARLQEEVTTYTQRSKLLETEIQGHRQYVNNLTSSFKDKQRKYQDQIRVLRRKIDEAQFESQKIRKEAEFNLVVLRTQHESQAKKLVEENARIAQRLKEVDQLSVSSRNSVQGRLKIKESEVENLTNVIQALKRKSQQDLNNQKQFYDTKLAASQAKYNQDLKIFNDKFISISSSNEKLLSQISSYSSKDSQIIELRRLLRQSTTLSTTVSHLWDVKEAQYSNINDVLNSMRT